MTDAAAGSILGHLGVAAHPPLDHTLQPSTLELADDGQKSLVARFRGDALNDGAMLADIAHAR